MKLTLKSQHVYGHPLKFAILFVALMVLVVLRASGNNVREEFNYELLSYETSVGGENDELDKIYKEFSELLPKELADREDAAGALGLSELADWLGVLIADSSDKLLDAVLMLFGISVLLALAEIFSSEAGDIGNTVKGAVSICLTVPVLNFSVNLIQSVKDGIISGSEFFSGAVPLMCAVSAIGGGVTTASVAGAGMSASLGFVSAFLAKNLFPVSTMIFCVSLISNFDTGQGTRRVASGIKGFFNFSIGAVSVVLLATLGLQTVITSSKDSMALRSARYAITGLVPVVGGTVSGALSTLISGAGIMMSTMGTLSVVMLFTCMGAPLVGLLLYRFSIGVAITFCELIGASFGRSFLEALRGALDTLIAVLASSLIIYILQIVIFMKATVGIA